MSLSFASYLSSLDYTSLSKAEGRKGRVDVHELVGRVQHSVSSLQYLVSLVFPNLPINQSSSSPHPTIFPPFLPSPNPFNPPLIPIRLNPFNTSLVSSFSNHPSNALSSRGRTSIPTSNARRTAEALRWSVEGSLGVWSSGEEDEKEVEEEEEERARSAMEGGLRKR